MVLLILSSLILIFGIEYISNPYVNYVINLQSNSSESIIIPKLPQENSNFNEYDKSNWSYQNTKLNDKNIFIFIMEQTDLQEFNKEVKKIEFENNFFEQHLNNSHYYNNYYTPNQDSRTAIWAMLNSQFIPYECYINDWNKKYGVVLENNNLIEFFNYKNYSTIFASAVYEFNLILAIYNWTEINHLRSFDKDNEEFICIQTYQTQKGCEDKILLNDIEKTLKQQKHKKIFFIQELIFGHGQEYMSRSKMSRTEYYTKYFKDFYEMLKKNNLSENSTIIVVSDHGDKGYFNKKISNYNIPMIIIDKDLEYKEINKTYNQLDFKDLLLHYVSNKKMPEENKEIYFIGQTGSYEFGYLNTKTNENFIGNFDEKEKNYEYTLNYQNTNNRNLIKDKIKYLIDYRKFMEKESLMKDYGCKFCKQNIKRVQEKHED